MKNSTTLPGREWDVLPAGLRWQPAMSVVWAMSAPSCEGHRRFERIERQEWGGCGKIVCNEAPIEQTSNFRA
eukprot:11226640-Lingulodinium_polyedra.AAC.1